MAERRPDTESERAIAEIFAMAQQMAKENRAKHAQKQKNEAQPEKDKAQYIQICKKCGEPLAKLREIPGMGQILTPNMCACKRAQKNAREEAERKQKADEARRRCFHGEEHQTEKWSADDATKNPDKRARNAIELIRRATTEPETWAKMRAKGIQGFILSGPTGTGKTFTACAAANAFIDQGKTAAFWHLPDLMAKWDGAKRTGSTEGFWAEILAPEIFVCDDLFAENATPAVKEFTFWLIDKRIERTKDKESMTIVTTNLNRDMLQGNGTGENRVFSRLRALSILDVPGTDARTVNDISKYKILGEILRQ